MKRTFELFEIEASMLPIFSTEEEWKQKEGLTDKQPTDGDVIAYGFDKSSQKYIPLYWL
ncbi:hypothetical protein [Neobacillus mesonae]|uniref:hypothetical protein n=1 Tax=Neobacillus mesonae TaxID=1193713 RepID=UPI0020421971|nr:hypothetical protein [Neobacillus mesonae]MCM3571271.1 hypothetical protein [Neobacillus mesonae]